MKNKCIFRSKISEAKFRHVLRLFSADLTGNRIEALSAINRVSINKIRQKDLSRHDKRTY